jgi:hypothetical protein
MINLIDPRPNALDDAIAHIEAAKAEGKITIGLEVTVPAIADRLNFNIDPQHSGGDSTQSCIKAVADGALSEALSGAFQKGDKVAFYTVRPDLDSFGAYTLAQWLMQCGEFNLADCADRIDRGIFPRVEEIHRADCFINSGNWSPRPMFSEGYEQSSLAAIARCVSDFKLNVEDRVAAMEKWLNDGSEPEGYREAYESDKAAIATAINTGATKVTVMVCDQTVTWRQVESINLGRNDRAGYAIVKSTLRAATSFGYESAPVVLAFNPEFPDRNLGKVKKFTICQYAKGYVDLPTVFANLSQLEPGWAGSPTIGGSPQGVSSSLTVEQVEEVLRSCMSI